MFNNMSEEQFQTILTSLRSLRLNQIAIIDSLVILTDSVFYQSLRQPPPRRHYDYNPSYIPRYQNRMPRDILERPPSARNLPPRPTNIEISLLDPTNTNQSGVMSQLFNTLLNGDPVSNSLSLQTIQDKTEILHYSDISSDSNVMCAICRVPFERNSIVRKIRGCNHYFHIGCIDNWFKDNTTCPVCRHDLLQSAGPQASTNL
tara:strand:+ start:481 stop:1089 length:609 start_codon:yes stop_codon:yes gene_type:complete